MNCLQVLSPLERQLVEAIAAGEPYGNISKRLGYSESWPSTIVGRIRDRFGCETTPQLIAKLFREGLLR